jgi:hypothetical protein
MVPIAIPNLPTQCTPVPQALKDNAGALNDPVKAETFLPGGPVDAECTFTPPIPGVTMKSHAEGTTVDSLAGFASFGAPGLGTLGSVTSHSVAKLDNATAVSQATSELFDVALAGGLVTIDHVASTAKETTDGQKAAGTGRTVITGLRIGGVPASVDSSGLRIGSLSAVANQALQSLGLEIQVTQPAILNDGAKGSFSAPLLVIRYRDDQNALEQAAVAMGQKLTTGSLQQVTGGLQQLALGPQAKVTLSMGGAVASVDASPALAETGVGGSPGGDVPGTPGTAGTSGTAGSAGTTVSGAALAAPASSATPNRSSGPVAAVARALAGFGGLAWGLVLVAVAAAVGLGLALYRYALALDAPSGAGAGRACGTDPGH